MYIDDEYYNADDHNKMYNGITCGTSMARVNFYNSFE